MVSNEMNPIFSELLLGLPFRRLQVRLSANAIAVFCFFVDVHPLLFASAMPIILADRSTTASFGRVGFLLRRKGTLCP